jgi:hypothetical protein
MQLMLQWKAGDILRWDSCSMLKRRSLIRGVLFMQPQTIVNLFVQLQKDKTENAKESRPYQLSKLLN